MATDRRGALLPLLFLTYLLLKPEPALRVAHANRQPLIDDAVAREQHALSVLLNSTWNPNLGSSTSTLNLTGLEPGRGFAWESLPVVKTKVHQQLEYALGDRSAPALTGEQVDGDAVPLYTNVTGHIRGSWKRSSLQDSIHPPQLNWTEYRVFEPFVQRARPVQSFHRNITGDHGTVRFRIEQGISSTLAGLAHAPHDTTEIVADVSFGEDELRLHGIYFTRLGQAILTTTSTKYEGIFALPHLALSQHTFDAARAVLNTSISRTIQRQVNRDTESLNPWISTTEDPSDPAFTHPECDIIVYLQQMVPSSRLDSSTAMIEFLEHELRFPTGAALPNPPDLRFSMLAFSPDCGFVLESKGPPEDFPQDGDHLTGPKRAVLFNHSRQHLVLYTATLALQLVLLMRQMREASTLLTRSRISFYTITMMALGDGFVVLAFVATSVFILGLRVNLVFIGFLSLIVLAFGLKLLMDVWQVQAPERERRARAEVEEERRREEAFQAAMERLRAQRDARRQDTAANSELPAIADQPDVAATNQDTAPPTSVPATVQAATLPRPVLAPVPVDTGATPVFMPSDQAGLDLIGEPGPANQTDTTAAVQARMPTFASLFLRFWLLLLATAFLSLSAASWPAVAQRVYFTSLAVMYLSFWIPQILRNIQRNCRHALHWEFVLGQSVLRLIPFAYFYAYENNVLLIDINYTGLTTLTTWVWIQIVVLVSQELIGPRWFIRKEWATAVYDYHPVLRADEEGATMPIGFSQIQEAATAPSSPAQERTPTSPIARRASVAKERREKGKRIFDCAICMQDLEVPIIEAGSSGDAGLAGGLLSRRGYMLAPCRHIFHSSCLEGWMKYRLQCPICRERLPPF